MSVIPPLPPIPDTPENWITRAIAAIYAAQDAQLETLGKFTTSLEGLMATVEELQAALDRNTAGVAAVSAAITQEIQQLKDAIDALSTAQPPTQAQLDQ